MKYILNLHRLVTLATVLALVAYLTSACSNGGGLNVFSIDDDISMGAKMEQEILADPTNYPILPANLYPSAYQNLQRITDQLLNSGQLKYRDKFAWKLHIIQRDDILNAFCAPGGYIYVYTGLIKYLDKESELAGVMGHEIAHADHRHSTEAMTKQLGAQFLLDILLGNSQNQITTLLGNVLFLKYSRNHETDADKASVLYLCNTTDKYVATGTAGFFQKLLDEGKGGGQFDFFSTHPSPDKRVETIHSEATKLACTGSDTYETRYKAFKAGLP